MVVARIVLVVFLLIVAGLEVGAQNCPGGTVIGEKGSSVTCKNLTTGQTVVIPLGGGRTWDCTAAGLLVSPGDRIRQTSSGKVPRPTSPATPTNLVACSPASGSVLLQWTETSFNETRLEITKFGTLEKTVEADVTSALITGLNPGTSYHWDLRACNSTGCSPFHGVVGRTPDGVLTLPATPAGLVISSPAPGSVLLKWIDTGCNETRFEITKFGTLEKTVEADVTSAFITGLNPGTSYHWDLRACNSAGCSPFHGVVGRTPDGSCP